MSHLYRLNYEITKEQQEVLNRRCATRDGWGNREFVPPLTTGIDLGRTGECVVDLGDFGKMTMTLDDVTPTLVCFDGEMDVKVFTDTASLEYLANYDAGPKGNGMSEVAPEDMQEHLERADRDFESPTLRKQHYSRLLFLHQKAVRRSQSTGIEFDTGGIHRTDRGVFTDAMPAKEECFVPFKRKGAYTPLVGGDTVKWRQNFPIGFLTDNLESFPGNLPHDYDFGTIEADVVLAMPGRPTVKGTMGAVADGMGDVVVVIRGITGAAPETATYLKPGDCITVNGNQIADHGLEMKPWMFERAREEAVARKNLETKEIEKGMNRDGVKISFDAFSVYAESDHDVIWDFHHTGWREASRHAYVPARDLVRNDVIRFGGTPGSKHETHQQARVVNVYYAKKSPKPFCELELMGDHNSGIGKNRNKTRKRVKAPCATVLADCLRKRVQDEAARAEVIEKHKAKEARIAAEKKKGAGAGVGASIGTG